MPFLNIALLEYMVQISDTFDVTVPRTRMGVEALCAIYSKNCLAVMGGLLEHNELKISKLFTMVKVRHIEESEIDRFDLERLSFFNVNTLADLDRARHLAESSGVSGQY